MRGADLRFASLRNADLRDANLIGADLSDADLRSANLSGAKLSGADLRDGDLRGADLSGANLSGADLRGANLRDADLSGANLRADNLSGADLSGAKGVILGPQRSDGYSFLLSKQGRFWRVVAGCRNMSVTEYRKHTMIYKGPGATDKRRETRAILDYLMAAKKARGIK